MGRWLIALVAAGCGSLFWSSMAMAIDSKGVKALLADPPREYATAPLWVWNDLLTQEQVVGTLRDLAGQGVKQAFVHPRPGLMTPYLSEDWFELWAAALDEAKRLDMNLWIYDENSYPSGFAGGWVPELMPESRGRGLVLREVKSGPKIEDSTLAVYRTSGERIEDVTAKARSGEDLPDAEYLVAAVQEAGTTPWLAGRFYVDLLMPGVTEKFLEVTLEPYRERFGAEFGQRIPGSFTDEPELLPAGGLPWTPDLPEQFEKRRGFALMPHLPALFREVGDWKRVRHGYYQTLLELFIERWGKPYHDYCEKNNLEFTGHYWEHEWPRCLMVPDNMAMYAWHQRPAIDTLMNRFAEDPHAQFGNHRAVKELSSVANQLGRQRTLCEAYGAGGWDLRFEDMKRIGDWLYVLGVNTMDEHLSYITIRGARKRDHPQSFSYHEPWWPDYHVMARYFARLSAVLSQGEEVNSILLIEPTTTAWMYNNEAGNHPRLKEIGESFQGLVKDLLLAQVEFDIGCEDIIARHGSVEGRALKVGRRRYTNVIIPPLTESLNARTMDLLEKFAEANGRIIGLGDPPARVDGQPSERGRKLAPAHAWHPADARKPLVDALTGWRESVALGVSRREGDRGMLFHHRRQLEDGQLLFLVNTSIEHPCSGYLYAAPGGVEEWDLATGTSRAYPASMVSDSIVFLQADFELPPCGSLLLFVSGNLAEPKPAASEKFTEIKPSDEVKTRPAGPNVLTLDYVDVTAGEETKENLYFYPAQQFVWQKYGLERNPWDSAVQYKDELISKKFPPDSGFKAVYKFTIAEQVPASLSIVIERPDLYAITCNGKPVKAGAGEWWLDKAFGRIDIASPAKIGENAVAIEAAPMTMFHELEPAYLLGDFSLRSAEKGFIIAPPQPLKLGKWNEQGWPMYADGVSYTQRFDVPAPATVGEKEQNPSSVTRYFVALQKWYGSVARVSVNGKPAGHIISAPWECDVTEAIRPGENTIEVTVIGTLKNTLGPHHGNPALGAAWPAAFHQGPNPGPPPGKDYSTVGYGLFEPFTLTSTESRP
ncbi:MAG: hypothetical protein AMXMBFR13_44060 [Phycisphaerae bacterium]